MDTHMTHMELEPSVRQTARLPDEPPLDTPLKADKPQASSLDEADAGPVEPVAKPHRKRRGRLLAGVALSALTLAAGSVLLVSPLNTAIPVPPSVLVLADHAKLAFAQGAQQVQGYVTRFLGSDENSVPTTPRGSATAFATTAVPIVAPAASLAGTRLPPRPDTVTASRYTALPRDQSLDEIRSFGAAKPAEPPQAQAKPPAAPAFAPTSTEPSSTALPDPASEVAEPGSTAISAPAVTKPSAPDITASVTQAALIQPTMPATGPAEPMAASVPQPEPIVVPRLAQPAAPVPQSAPDAVSIKPLPQSSRPAVLVLSVPAGHEEQAEVLQYVTGLTSEITRLRTENELLRKDVGRRMAEQDSRLADFNRRVSVAETRAAMRSAADAGRSDDPASPPPSRPMQLASASSALPPAATDTRPVTPANRVRYRVQAASPGLALLAEVGRGGGDGAQLQVAVGDQIPGYGVVKSVSQRGPNWVVQTERGSID